MTLFPTLPIMGSYAIWHVSRSGREGSLHRRMSDTLPRYSLSAVLSLVRHFVRELSRLALLSSYTIWNARQEPAWGSENQPLICPWSFSFPFHLLIPLSVSSCFCFLFHPIWPHNFLVCDILSFMYSPASVWATFVVPKLRPGLVCTSFILLLPFVDVFHKGWYNNTFRMKSVILLVLCCITYDHCGTRKLRAISSFPLVSKQIRSNHCKVWLETKHNKSCYKQTPKGNATNNTLFVHNLRDQSRPTAQIGNIAQMRNAIPN